MQIRLSMLVVTILLTITGCGDRTSSTPRGASDAEIAAFVRSIWPALQSGTTEDAAKHLVPRETLQNLLVRNPPAAESDRMRAFALHVKMAESVTLEEVDIESWVHVPRGYEYLGTRTKDFDVAAPAAEGAVRVTADIVMADVECHGRHALTGKRRSVSPHVLVTEGRAYLLHPVDAIWPIKTTNALNKQGAWRTESISTVEREVTAFITQIWLRLNEMEGFYIEGSDLEGLLMPEGDFKRTFRFTRTTKKQTQDVSDAYQKRRTSCVEQLESTRHDLAGHQSPPGLIVDTDLYQLPVGTTVRRRSRSQPELGFENLHPAQVADLRLRFQTASLPSREVVHRIPIVRVDGSSKFYVMDLFPFLDELPD